MIFSSLFFIFIYLAAVLLIYYLLPKRFRNIFLFAANLIFYAFGEPVFVVVMLFSIVINYIGGLMMGKYEFGSKQRKTILGVNAALDILLLCIFKYTGFFAGVLKSIPMFSFIIVPKIPLPIGISFYTFQTMSYIIDVYRNDAKPQHDFVAFGNYVALFPQLIAGPIVRYHDVDAQLTSREETFDKFESGVKRFTVGLAKKVLIANEMGAMYKTLAAMHGGALGAWSAAIAFSFQLYFDFSGYSDMAIGLGRMMGFEFLENFDHPYISRSITEFWRRWHMSLGTWFKEYVYIPLGGNRVKPARHIFNIFVVWVLTGFWHGASWNFMLWGAYYGVILLLEKFLLLKPLKKLPAFVSHIYTLFFVVMGWVLFSFENMGEMIPFIGRMFGSEGLTGGDAVSVTLAYLPLLIIAAVASTEFSMKLHSKLEKRMNVKVLDAILVGIVLLLCTASLVSSSYNPFLYFRF